MNQQELSNLDTLTESIRPTELTESSGHRLVKALAELDQKLDAILDILNNQTNNILAK